MSSVTQESAAKPMRKDALRNRQLLIAAAREVFAERGLDASLDDVAHRAGVGVGTAYRHFANKHELAEAIFGEAIDTMVALAEAAAASPDPWAGLVAFAEGAAEQQVIDRGLREVLAGAHDPEKMDQVSVRLSGPLNHVIARAKQAGQLREDASGTDVWLGVMMLCTVSDITADVRPDLWRRYLPMVLDALRAGTRTALPVPPIAEDDLREAMRGHKHRLQRATAR